MRDIRGDLQDRTGFLEEQISVTQAQFEKHMEQLTLEHQARIADLQVELEAVTTLMEGECRRLTSEAGDEERRQPAPQPVQQAGPERQRAPEPQQFHREAVAEAAPRQRVEPQHRPEPEAQQRPEPQPYGRPVTAEAEPVRAPSPSRDEHRDRPATEPEYQPRPQPAGEPDPYRQPAAAEAPQPRRPMPAAESAPQIYRRAPLAQDRGRRPAPVAPQPQQPQSQQPQQPQQQPQQPPLADFLIRKLSEAGAMTLEGLCQFAVQDGYFAEGENPNRSVQVTLMNVVKAGFIRQLPNGTFAPATVMDTIRLRRAI